MNTLKKINGKRITPRKLKQLWDSKPQQQWGSWGPVGEAPDCWFRLRL